MGLCKCPQRKVTNIFCYEHRVNVCEYCLMQNHPKCVVDTYRNWITDSVFSTKCGLCDEELETAETIRLLCFHIVHWDCLDSWARSLPATTAPAGYSCPVCKKMCLFPPKNQVSPIADALRDRMGQVNWARAGLGLPLLDNEVIARKSSTTIVNGIGHSNETGQYNPMSMEASKSSLPSDSTKQSLSHVQNNHDHTPSPYSPASQSYTHVSNHNQSPYYSDAAASSYAASSRKSIRSDFETPLFIDEDEHKYHRRSPMESLSRWMKNFMDVKGKRGRKRSALYVIICIIAVIVVVMLIFGRNGNMDDDTFDPIANPNVLVGNGKGIGIGAGQDEET